MRSLAEEVLGQPEALARFARSRLPRAARGSIFVGAGDSYAAAMAAFYASGGRCVALDPYTLASAPEVAEGLEVYFISVSGKTASNVSAARRVRRLAKRTVAVTAERGSDLARLADDVAEIPMAYAPRTSGMLSFTLSLLAVLKVVGQDCEGDFEKAFVDARRDAGRVSVGKGTTYFLGNGLGHPAALYAAAKCYELLGARAHAELLEEFSHLELFSLRRPDAVNAFSCFDPSKMADRLAKALRGVGFEAQAIPSRGRSVAERLLHSVFVAQLAVIDEAGRAGLSEPRFLRAGKRLRTSDSMIY